MKKIEQLKYAIAHAPDDERRALVIETLSDEFGDVQMWLEQQLLASGHFGKDQKENMLWIECAHRYRTVAEQALSELRICQRQLERMQADNETVG